MQNSYVFLNKNHSCCMENTLFSIEISIFFDICIKNTFFLYEQCFVDTKTQILFCFPGKPFLAIFSSEGSDWGSWSRHLTSPTFPTPHVMSGLQHFPNLTSHLQHSDHLTSFPTFPNPRITSTSPEGSRSFCGPPGSLNRSQLSRLNELWSCQPVHVGDPVGRYNVCSPTSSQAVSRLVERLNYHGHPSAGSLTAKFIAKPLRWMCPQASVQLTGGLRWRMHLRPQLTAFLASLARIAASDAVYMLHHQHWQQSVVHRLQRPNECAVHTGVLFW